MKNVIRYGHATFLFLTCFCAIPVHSVGPYVPLEQLVAEAETIVVGKVIELEAIVEHQAIYTDITLRINQTLKGSLSESEVTFRSLGGQYKDLVYEVEGNIIYHKDDLLIVLLKRHNTRWVLSATAESSVISGDSQSNIDQITAFVSGRAYYPETNNGRAIGQNGSIPSITAVRPQGATGIDQHECIQIEGSNFGDLSDGRIRFMRNYRRNEFVVLRARVLDLLPLEHERGSASHSKSI